MTRRPFGDTPDSVAVDPSTGDFLPGAVGTVWTAQTGGVQLFDLQTMDGEPLASGQVVADQTTALVAFLGPDDGTDECWIDFGHGRYLMQATDTDERVAALEPQVADHETRLTVVEGKPGVPNGYATLDAGGRIPAVQLPAVYATSDELASLQSSVDAYKTSTASIEELCTSVQVAGLTNGASVINQITTPFIVTLFAAPFPLKITACTLAWDYWSCASSNTDYWSFALEKMPPAGASSYAVIATKTVQTTGGEPISARKAWSFDAVPFDPTAQQMAKGDLLGINMMRTGSPPLQQLPLMATISYQPL